MKKITLFLLLLSLVSTGAQALVMDAPHNEITCVDCHNYSAWWRYSPVSASNEPSRGGITTAVCLRCHNNPDGPIPYKKPHSSVSFGATAQHGDWSTNCIDCHDPHFQAQLDWRGTNSAELFLVTGTIGAAGSLVQNGNGTTTFTYTTTEVDPLWDDPNLWTNKTGSARSLILVDDTQQALNTYLIVAADTNTLTVKSALNSASAGHTFGLIYGQLIKSSIATPHGGSRTVKLFNPKVTFALGGFTEPGTPSPQGVCQVCHTVTKYWQSDGSLTDHNSAESCNSCHPATVGFAHGGGVEGGGTGCQGCHGKDASEGGYGTTISHATHTANDANHLKGPHITCDACHDTNNFPFFKSGLDGNDDGRISLAETDVCNTCHSPGGTYDGVNDLTLGAKANWPGGIYEADTVTLKSGKERWCATCHDESTAVIGGISAPNVVGDEGANSTYGTGYGFYKTGHGLANDQTYPSSGGATAGAGLGCNNCHDFSLAHVDGKARTFACEDGCDNTEYRDGYRLKLVNGQAPMQIPLTGFSNDSSQFRLCYSCHDSGPFLEASNLQTNLISTGTDGIAQNRHQYHLNFAYQLRYPADYNYSSASNSRVTCVTCHNVHGSTRLAMVNDGRLINREPGLRIWYNNPEQVTYNPSSSNPPLPESVPLTASTGTLISYGSSTNLCGHCHGNNNVTAEDRNAYQNVSVSSTEPAAEAVDVPLNSAVTIIWDQEIDCSTVTTATVTISPAVGWIKTSCVGQQAAFRPSGQSGSSLYIVTVSDSVRDTNGGAMALSYPFSYTTAAPTVAAPTMGAPTVVSTSAIQWDFTDNANNEEGFKLHDADQVMTASASTPNESSLTETGLSANTRYTRHIHAYREGEDSLASASVAAYTLPVVPDVTADTTTSNWHTTADVVFSNVAGFGDGAVQHYRYAWDTSATHTYNDSEPQWTSGTLTKTANAEGSWYLHVKSYNGDNVANATTADYGPYNFDGVVLAVSSTSPSAGATNGVTDGNVTINFNEDIDCATVTASTITITPSVGWNRTSCSGSQAVFEPNGQSSSTPYTVTVSTSVMDANAIPLSSSHQFSYTTVTEGGVITVCKTGTCDFTTIQGAINDAGTTNGKVVRVTDSATYSEKINFQGKLITVQSANGAAQTKIDGDGTNSPVVTFSSGETSSSVLDGFTIDNKAATAQGATRGIYIANSSSPTIRNSIVEGNAVTNCGEDSNVCGGGGVYIKSSAPTFETSIIRNNSITNRFGGGVYVSGSASAPTFTATTISGNTSNQHAGGIYSNAAPLTLTNCTISSNQTGNSVSYDGGGLYLTGSTAQATISGGTFSSNSGRAGGAIYMTGSTAASPLSIQNATITSNTGYIGAGIYLTAVTNPSTITNTTISSNTSAQFGGGINSNSPLTITDSHIDNNTVTSINHDGGGIYLSTATATANISNTSVNGNTARGGAGIYITNDADVTFTGGTVSNNSCYSGSGGGGINIANAGSSLNISKVIISGNRGGSYGGGVMNSATATISNCTITGNTTDQQTYSDGGGIYSTGTLDIYNSTIAGNYAKRYGGGLRVQSGTATVSNSILYGNTAGTSNPQISGTPVVSYADVGGGFTGTGNIAADPLFVSFTVPDDQAGDNAPKTSGNYHLQSASPCRNAGNNANAPVGTDMDGDSRIMDGTVDMGSDEMP